MCVVECTHYDYKKPLFILIRSLSELISIFFLITNLFKFWFLEFLGTYIVHTRLYF